MSRKNKYFKIISSTLSLILLGTFFYQIEITPIKEFEDSQDYIHYANAIRNNIAVSTTDRSIIRTPFYPFLLSYFPLIEDSRSASVKTLHFLVMAATFLASFSMIYNLVSFLRFLLAFSISITLMKVFFFSLLTEWTSFLFLILLACSSIKHIKKPSLVTFSINSLVSCILIMTRPALLPVYVVPFLLLFITRYKLLKSLLIIILSIIPIHCLCYANYLNYSSYTLSPFTGVSLFGVSTLIQNDQTISNGTKDLNVFAGSFSSKRLIVTQVDNTNKKLEGIYNANIWRIAEGIRNNLRWDYVKFNKVLGEYAMKVIKSSPWKYFKYTFCQWISQFRLSSIILNLSILILALWIIFQSTNKCYSQAVGMMLSVHELHLLLCASTNVIFYRLEVLTLIPLLLTCLLLLKIDSYQS